MLILSGCSMYCDQFSWREQRLVSVVARNKVRFAEILVVHQRHRTGHRLSGEENDAPRSKENYCDLMGSSNVRSVEYPSYSDGGHAF